MKCKITNSELTPFMSFGKMPAANGFLKKEHFASEFFYEMEVGFSSKISLLQLNDHSNPINVHNENYPFYTSSSQSMKKHFQKHIEVVMQASLVLEYSVRKMKQLTRFTPVILSE